MHKNKATLLIYVPFRVIIAKINTVILRGRVKFPIGGKVRERIRAGFGAIPKPTV